jgi:hypothetical protein
MSQVEQAERLCEEQAAAWRSMLEPIGFNVATEVSRVDADESCRLALRAERGATRVEVEAQVKITPDAPAWSIRAPIYRGDTEVMVARTALLVFSPRLLVLISRLESMDPKRPAIKFGPSTWSAKTKVAPPLAGGVRVASSRGDAKTDAMLATLARTAATLYSIVVAAQTADPSVTPEGNAQQEVLLATAALMASEIESFLQLVALGLEGPALVHARAAGDFATRMSMFRNNPELALTVYESFPASIVEAIGLFRDDDTPSAVLADGTPEKSMRRIESQESFKVARNKAASEEHLLSLAEHGTMSKRTHGDVTAMALIAGALATRGSDVRTAIARVAPVAEDNEITVRSTIVRVMGWALHAAVDLINVIHVDTQGQLESLNAEHGKWQRNIAD